MWSYRSSSAPYSGHCGCGGYIQGYSGWFPSGGGWPQVCYAAWPGAWCPPEPWAYVPMELTSDTSNPSQQALVGGSEKAFLTLEYLPDSGATSASVTVTITDTGGSSQFNLTTIPAGYHVKNSFVSAAPGATVKLDVAQCTAHLRWFEFVA